MADSKYGKYIITELKENIAFAPWGPPIQNSGKEPGDSVLYLDNEVIPGAFYVETDWYNPREKDEPVDKYPRTVVTPHAHNFDEVLCFFGTDFDDPHDLRGEIEFWLGDEKHMFTKSSIVFIPKQLQHGPLIYHRVEKPIFSFSLGPGKMYL
jgi:hypothetical protein